MGNPWDFFGQPVPIPMNTTPTQVRVWCYHGFSQVTCGCAVTLGYVGVSVKSLFKLLYTNIGREEGDTLLSSSSLPFSLRPIIPLPSMLLPGSTPQAVARSSVSGCCIGSGGRHSGGGGPCHFIVVPHAPVIPSLLSPPPLLPITSSPTSSLSHPPLPCPSASHHPPLLLFPPPCSPPLHHRFIPPHEQDPPTNHPTSSCS
jgi:hypothetical protein